jgi:LuxR family maltose regulon positive regulatory protein
MKYQYKDSHLLKTKLQIPHLPADYISKYKLIEFLNIGMERPLTLVSAGAGFGKSTFISSWLKQLKYKHGWVSIDENDNDLQLFLKYFIAAIQQSLPGFGAQTQTLLSTPNLPPAEILINNLINDLNDLSEFFVLVFDDIYLVNNLKIYELLSAILRYPPHNFHLVLISRSDPPLPLHKLRASNKIKEVRITDLQFTDIETGIFINKYLNIENTDNIISLLKQKTEGWATGLRLAMMHISYHFKNEKDIEKHLNGINFSETYFIEEVLNHLDSITVEFLLKTSILNKFCPSLTAQLLSQSDNKFDSKEIIKRLKKENLFIINLDEENNWYRYHHLFLSLLRKELKNRYPSEQITLLNQNALEWYEKESFINEALYHASQTNNIELTTSLIEKHMHKPLNENKWFYLEQWLKKIPDNYIYQSPVLLIAQMWILQHKNMIWLIPELINNLEEIRKRESLDFEIELQLQFFQGVILFWSAKIKKSLVLFDYVRKNLSSDKVGAISLACIYYVNAAQMNGDGGKVYLELEKKVYGKHLNPTFKTILFGSLLYMKFHEGELYTAERLNHQLKDFSLSVQDIFSQTWSDYFFAYIAFQQNKPEIAYSYFKQSIRNVYFLNMIASMDNFAGLLLTLKTLNKHKEYQQVYAQLLAFTSEQNNPAFSTIAYSVRARLSLLENDIPSAVKHIKMADMNFDSGNTQFFIESPRLTYCRVLLAQNRPDKITEAIEKLEEHLNLAIKTRNVYQLIRISIIQSIAFIRTNNQSKAKESLELAIEKAFSNNWIRPFVEDGGKEIQNLLKELADDKKLGKFVAILLYAISTNDRSNNKNVISTKASLSNTLLAYNPLTNRALDIINLLAKRLSNKEIANELYISSGTVKRHTINIYQKLGVNKRRDAVNTALELNLLS